ncbi:MAG: four helix bundle protein, partial [Desulfatirhabdiaceae bacterium]
FREYDIWKSSIQIAKQVYLISELFPSSEKFGLSSQIQRAVISIASNIAEGSARKSEKEFAHFLEIAQGSAFEVETQLILAKEIGYIQESSLVELLKTIHVLQKQINYLRSKLK